MKRFLRNNGLSLAMAGLFLIFLAGQTITGFLDFNEDQIAHGRVRQPFSEYLVSGHYLESVFENWESEFLQMAAYVVLTVFLYQKGSAESKDPDEKADEKAGHLKTVSPQAPWPVRRGGWILHMYEHSLSIALSALFLLSFCGHVFGGCRHMNEERMQHGQAPISCVQYLKSARFWFESFQNWQSEFLAVFSIVFLSVWLREKGSPESKPVAASHEEGN